MATVGTAQELKAQIDGLMVDKKRLEEERTNALNDPTILDFKAKKARIDRELYPCKSYTPEQIWGISYGQATQNVHQTCKDDRNCSQRPWVDGSGNIWCGADSTGWYNRASVDINSNMQVVNEKQSKINEIDKQIKELNEKLISYSNTNAGTQEVKDLAEIEKTKLQTEQIKVNVQTEITKNQARKEVNKKSLLWITIIIVVLITLGVIFWWLKSRKKKN